MRVLAALKHAATTAIVITHRPSLLGSIDKVLVLREGTVEQFGPRSEVFAKVARGTVPAGPASVVRRMEG
jgi:ABC-type protease/lipase transport system fused ATPase/permease subunit